MIAEFKALMSNIDGAGLHGCRGSLTGTLVGVWSHWPAVTAVVLASGGLMDAIWFGLLLERAAASEDAQARRMIAFVAASVALICLAAFYLGAFG